MLKLELKEIRAQQDLLFRFMSFLKQEGAVHVLQFCLTVGKTSPWRSAPSRARRSALTDVHVFCCRGVQRPDPESGAERGGAAASARRGAAHLPDLLPGGERRQDPLRQLHRGGDPERYVLTDATSRSRFSQRVSLPLMFCLLLLPQLLKVAMATW